jgi:hypothetical protein
MNNAFINSYFHGGSSKFRDGYKISSMKPELTGHIDSLTMSDKEGATEFIRNLLVSVFIHETTYIKTTDLFPLFKYLSVDRALRLLQSDAIKLVDDNGLDTGLLIDADDKKFIGFFENSYMYPDHKKAEHFESSFDYLSFQVSKAPLPKEIKSALLFNVEKRSVILNVDNTIEKIKKELDYDFSNQNVTRNLGIIDGTIENVESNDIDKIFRLVKSNQGLLYSALLKSENLICEANASNDFKLKFNDLYSINQNKSVDSFHTLANNFGIPDFTDLILNDILSIDEYLKLREKRGAEKFRDWLFELNHDKEKAIDFLLRDTSSSSNKSLLLKFLRWSFSNGISAIEPITGIIYSAADTFVLDKLYNGWSPNLYLNNSLSTYLNKKVTTNEKKEIENSKEKYFGNTGRNDKCPCQSGKKFKHCCGK